MANIPEALSALLDSLKAGTTPAAAQLTVFSDLDRDAAAALRIAWPSISSELRRSTLVRARELSDDSVDLNFTELGRAGLDDPEADVRRAAIESLWEGEDRRVGQRLATLLRSDPDDSVRAAAASGLAVFAAASENETIDRVTGDEAVDALRAAAAEDEPSLDIRGRAVESLGIRSLPWVETLISDAYYHEDRGLRLAAIRAMGHSGGGGWLEILEEEVQSDDPEFRFAVATALGEIESEQGVEVLSDLLADEDTEVVLAAVMALGQVGGSVAEERLETFIESVEGTLAEAAKEALEEARSDGSVDLMRQRIGL